MKYFKIALLFTFIKVHAVCQSKDTLPPPNATKSAMNFSKVIGWEDKIPVAPPGFKVNKFAIGFRNPRWLYVLPNGDVLVAESNSNFTFIEKAGAVVTGAIKAEDVSGSADRITLLRDTDNDGIADKKDTLLTSDNGLKQPFGMLLLNNWLYVANTNALVRYPYEVGQTSIADTPQKIIDLPAGKSFKDNRHWTRNLISNAKNSKLYISVGSSSNIAENGIDEELLRADILEINPDGSGMRVYASGLRNPVGMDWAPGTNTLWAAVNERDELGDDLVPDYLTGVKPGGFYGWPYAYWGNHTDSRVKAPRPDLVNKTIVPDVDLGSHGAPLGLLFYTGKSFPSKYHGGVFIAQHGSWNKSVLAGYKVVYIPFSNGKPAGKMEDFLTGFIADAGKSKVYGRPVGLAMLPDGSLLVADDAGNTIWRVSAGNK